MDGPLINDLTTQVVKRGLDFRSENQAIISGNIANADTPGYVGQELAFKHQLQTALTNIREAPEDGRWMIDDEIPEIRDTGAERIRDLSTPMGNDLNNVEVDKEFGKLTGNALEFEALSTMLHKKSALLKYAIADGGDR